MEAQLIANGRVATQNAAYNREMSAIKQEEIKFKNESLRVKLTARILHLETSVGSKRLALSMITLKSAKRSSMRRLGI